MRNKFYKVKLKDILSVKRGTSLSGQYYATSGDKIRLTLGNFNYPNGGFKNNTSKDNIYFSAPVKSEYILKKGDIITPLTEQVAGLLGETAKIPEDDLYIQSGDIALIIPKEDKLYKDFAYYLISSKMIKYQLGAAAQQTKIRHTSPEKIENCEAWIPQDIETQRDISHLLDTINDKIALNNKINQELEQMAKTLYEYWFVQFDFPDEKGRPYKSANGKMVYNDILKREIPEGWEVLKLENRFAFERGKEYGSQLYKDSKQSDNDIKFYRVGDMDDSGSTYIDKTTVDYCPMITKNDVVVSFDGSVGRIGFALNGTYSTGMRKIYDYENVIKSSTIYFIFNDDRIQATISKYASGSNILHASASIEHLVIPYNEKVYLSFQQKIEPIFNKMIDIVEENKKLTELRDFLLPLLMNGQVSVQN